MQPLELHLIRAAGETARALPFSGELSEELFRIAGLRDFRIASAPPVEETLDGVVGNYDLDVVFGNRIKGFLDLNRNKITDSD